MHEDIYFLNSEEALRVASEQNRWGEDVAYNLQACYYDGEKLESDLPNLFHLPIENLLEGLVYGRDRIPSKIDFSGLEISSKVKMEILSHFNNTMEQAKHYRSELNSKYLHELRNAKLDFSEPLRFYLIANDRTTVMQYVSKSIADVLKDKGYEVLFDLYRGTEDQYSFKRVYEFNPHVTININHFNNKFLSQDVFNFVWFQDPMGGLVDESKPYLRDRDYIYSLLSDFDYLLKNKNIPFERQSFCIDEKIYKKYENIQREKKIVFVGSSYRTKHVESAEMSELIDYLIELFQNGKSFTDALIDEIATSFSIDKTYLITHVLTYVVRDLSVLWLCSIKSEYKIEIYGHGWDYYETVAPYYKGVLAYGEDIAKVYNSATIAFSPHSMYVLQNRVLESTACGAIPIVYDCRDVSDEPTYDEAMYYFKTFDDLKTLLTQELESRDFSRLLAGHSYEKFVDRMLDILKKSLEK